MCSISMSPSSSSTTLTSVEQTQLDTNFVTKTSNIARADMTVCNCKNELEIAQTNTSEAITALEDLVKGIKAVKRILEQPIGSKEYGESSCAHESPDAKLVSNLSENLVGILGSELLGLLNAAQMAKDHAKLRVEDERNVIQDLHHTSQFARALNVRLDKVERKNLRLTAEKKLLVKEVRSLRGDRQLLIKEVKSLRKILQFTRQYDDWRLLEDRLRAAVGVHESVLSNKTFQSGFAAGADPPGLKVTKEIDVEDKYKDVYDHTSASSSVSEKENSAKCIPRKETDGFEACNSNQKQLKSMLKAEPSPKSSFDPIPSKKRGLPFQTGFSNSLTAGFGRFKNVLQEASEKKRCHEDSDVEPGPHVENYHRREISTQFQCQNQSLTNVEGKLWKFKRNENNKENDENNDSIISNCIILDDDATKSTKSCSFETETLNLSSSAINYGDDGMTKDLALQISIDDGASLLDNASFPPHLMITPDSSPIARQCTKVLLKPTCTPNVLRTLAMPNGNTVGETISSLPALKPQLRFLHTRR